MLTLLAAVILAAADPAPATEGVQLSAEQMFDLAGRWQQEGRLEEAETAYRALSTDPHVELRSEARFRLAQLIAGQKRDREAALLLRAILDENPQAQPVRLELAALLARMGDLGAARRELRAVSAGSLPSEVRLLVERSHLALRSLKPFGGSLQLGFAGDSNVNRATNAETLGTVIGDFALSDDARETSGTGARGEAQAYVRLPLGRHQLSLSAAGSASLYRRTDFNDVSLSLRAGPEFSFGPRRLSLSLTGGRRWFGGERLQDQLGVSADLLQPLGSRTQARLGLASTRLSGTRNPLEAGWSHGGSLQLDRALATTRGVGATLSLVRLAARDPGYAQWTRGIGLYGYQEVGRATLTLSLGASRLEADERLMLYPEVRRDTLLRGQLGMTMRRLQWQGFAPQLRLVAERNSSSVGIYDYKRRAVEAGLVRAF